MIDDKQRLSNRRRLFTWPLTAAIISFCGAQDPVLGERLAKAAGLAVFSGIIVFIVAALVNPFRTTPTHTVNPFADRRTLGIFLFLVGLMVVGKAVEPLLNFITGGMALLVIWSPWKNKEPTQDPNQVEESLPPS
jgi:uncharacterized membrane protein YhaH (DUF805 family)